MSDKILDPDDSEDVTEWMFPQIDLSTDSDDDLNESDSESHEQDLNNELAMQLNIKNLEIERLQAELKNKISILNNIMSQLDYPLSNIDKDFIDLIQSIIKKSVKNIIAKEIESDPDVINAMVNSLKELIHENSGMLTMFLSETDFKRFSQDEMKDLFSIKVDPALNEGDIIIKSNYAEIRSILDERLDKMIGLKK